jgi:uncharacterized membrane protein YphA (DoxX/SURF4 family)
MRFAVGFSATHQGVETLIASDNPTLASWTIGLVAIFVGAALFVGFLTPITGTSAAIGNSALVVLLFAGPAASAHDKVLTAIDVAVLSIALVLLGPGAFSLDAYLFGRREIIIPKGNVPRSHSS